MKRGYYVRNNMDGMTTHGTRSLLALMKMAHFFYGNSVCRSEEDGDFCVTTKNCTLGALPGFVEDASRLLYP